MKKFVLIEDTGGDMASFKIPFAGEYEALLAQAPKPLRLPPISTRTRATTFYTTGTTGLPKGVYFSHRQLVPHLAVAAHHRRRRRPGPPAPRRRVYADHPDVPRPCLGSALRGDAARHQAGLSGPLRARYADPVSARREGDLLALRADHHAHDADQPPAKDVDFSGWKVIIGGSALPKGLASAGIARAASTSSPATACPKPVRS